MKRLVLIIILVSTLLQSCSLYGNYKNRFNNSSEKSWIKINKDSTFEYTIFNRRIGFGYTKGLWSMANDTIYIVESKPKLPKKNRIVEIQNDENKIRIFDMNGKQSLPMIIKLNHQKDSILTNIESEYAYDSKLLKIKTIEVFDMNPSLDMVASFKTKCDNCSYNIYIDYENVAYKKVKDLQKKWIYKQNRLFPIDTTYWNYGKILYYKKGKQPNKYHGWFQESYDKMKIGFD